MRKRGILLIVCLCILMVNPVTAFAKETENHVEESAHNIQPRGVFTERKWYGCEGGAGVTVDILKNDTGNRIYIMGISLVDKNGDIGITKDSISMTHKIYDNGAYAVITLKYVDFGKQKSRNHTIYAY